jgi:hypothetical protein
MSGINILTAEKQVPVFILHVDPEQWGLSNVIKKHRIKHPESHKSNVNAWHSAWDTHKVNPKFKPVAKHIVEACEFIMEGYYDYFGKLKCKELWAMQYDVGDSARRHAHFPYTFACAYYVDVEDGCSPIVFEGKLKVPAETGRLVIFPADLQHEVPPTDSKRTVISANICLTN